MFKKIKKMLSVRRAKKKRLEELLEKRGQRHNSQRRELERVKGVISFYQIALSLEQEKLLNALSAKALSKIYSKTHLQWERKKAAIALKYYLDLYAERILHGKPK